MLEPIKNNREYNVTHTIQGICDDAFYSHIINVIYELNSDKDNQPQNVFIKDRGDNCFYFGTIYKKVRIDVKIEYEITVITIRKHIIVFKYNYDKQPDGEKIIRYIKDQLGYKQK